MFLNYALWNTVRFPSLSSLQLQRLLRLLGLTFKWNETVRIWMWRRKYLIVDLLSFTLVTHLPWIEGLRTAFLRCEFECVLDYVHQLIWCLFHSILLCFLLYLDGCWKLESWQLLKMSVCVGRCILSMKIRWIRTWLSHQDQIKEPALPFQVFSMSER